MTSKITNDVEAPASGVLKKIYAKEGDTISLTKNWRNRILRIEHSPYRFVDTSYVSKKCCVEI